MAEFSPHVRLHGCEFPRERSFLLPSSKSIIFVMADPPRHFNPNWGAGMRGGGRGRGGERGRGAAGVARGGGGVAGVGRGNTPAVGQGAGTPGGLDSGLRPAARSPTRDDVATQRPSARPIDRGLFQTCAQSKEHTWRECQGRCIFCREVAAHVGQKCPKAHDGAYTDDAEAQEREHERTTQSDMHARVAALSVELAGWESTLDMVKFFQSQVDQGRIPVAVTTQKGSAGDVPQGQMGEGGAAAGRPHPQLVQPGARIRQHDHVQTGGPALEVHEGATQVLRGPVAEEKRNEQGVKAREKEERKKQHEENKRKKEERAKQDDFEGKMLIGPARHFVSSGLEHLERTFTELSFEEAALEFRTKVGWFVPTEKSSTTSKVPWKVFLPQALEAAESDEQKVKDDARDYFDSQQLATGQQQLTPAQAAQVQHQWQVEAERRVGKYRQQADAEEDEDEIDLTIEEDTTEMDVDPIGDLGETLGMMEQQAAVEHAKAESRVGLR